MSVVVWDGKTLAVDRQATCGELRMNVRKARYLACADETVAWTGDHELGIVLANWYENGAKPEDWPPAQRDKDRWCRLIVVSRRGGLKFYEMEPVAQRYRDAPYAAFGSGRDFALGALAMGATAEQAAEVACRFCVTCGGGVDVFRVGR